HNMLKDLSFECAGSKCDGCYAPHDMLAGPRPVFLFVESQELGQQVVSLASEDVDQDRFDPDRNRDKVIYIDAPDRVKMAYFKKLDEVDPTQGWHHQGSWDGDDDLAA